MPKIVINVCYGGFGLSEAAVERMRELGEDKYMHIEGEYYSDDIPRDNPILVQVVEEMGKAASGKLSNLAIVEIPDDVKWHIAEYDGFEHVAEDHRTWS